MDIKNPLYLKKIIEHYQNRINKLRSDKGFEIRTDMANGFIDETLKETDNLINSLDDVDQLVRINETSFPYHQKIICMALNQYMRDLDADWNTLENRLAHDPSYLKQIKKETEITKSIKKDCHCDS